jgi:hypothetical protein
MADLNSSVYHLFKSDFNAAVEFLLDNMDRVREYDTMYEDASSTTPSTTIHSSKNNTSEDTPIPTHPFQKHVCNSEFCCKACESYNVRLDEANADVICLDCGCCNQYLSIGADGLSYEEQVNAGLDSYYAPKFTGYKRLQHFNDLLNQLQGRRDVEVPKDIVGKIEECIEWDHSKDKITMALIRKVIKKLKLGHKHYENAQIIVEKLTKNSSGKASLLRIPHHVEREMVTQFMRIEAAWTRDKGSTSKASRKSFLSYTYVIKQLLQLMGEGKLAEAITTIKSKPRLKAHDEAWKHICELCDFEYTPIVKHI